MMGKKVTTEQMLGKATDRLTSDIAMLTQKRDSTISMFRNTARNLEQINADLQVYAERFETLAAFAQAQKAEADKMIADNDKVRAKMLEIIGE